MVEVQVLPELHYLAAVLITTSPFTPHHSLRTYKGSRSWSRNCCTRRRYRRVSSHSCRRGSPNLSRILETNVMTNVMTTIASMRLKTQFMMKMSACYLLV